ncbi:MAG: 3-deoxy-manno-octulosonate cytidylyltransferase [Promethearchaeota archaeon]
MTKLVELAKEFSQRHPGAKVVAVIPARLGSEEVHAKVLEDLGGKPVIQHVYERVRRAGIFHRILHAVDHQRIVEVVEGYGGEVVTTKTNHVCGSDRCAEAVADLRGVDVVVNVQADEPFLNPATLLEVVDPLLQDPELDVATPCCRFRDDRAAANPFNVKVVRRSRPPHLALYFSRSLVPFQRTPGILPHYQHLGVYAFRFDALMRFAALGPSPLELREGLEQLRALEHAFRVLVVETQHSYAGIAINTPDDLRAARRVLD